MTLHEEYSEYQKISKDKKLVLFGTGLQAIKLINKYVYNENVAYFVDNNAKLWGKKFGEQHVKLPKKKFLETTIYSPEKLIQDNDKIVVIIASSFYEEIAEQLKNMGIKYVYSYLIFYNQTVKRIAIQFFGHFRTFEYTVDSLVKNLIEANRKDGYEIDVFVHTWDILEGRTWHGGNKDIEGIKLTQEHANLINNKLFPKKLKIDSASTEEHLQGKSLEAVCKLRKNYEQEHGVEYKWVIESRLDILCLSEFRINDFIGWYDCTLRDFEYDENTKFVASSTFKRAPVYEPREWVHECDILYFARPQYLNNFKTTVLLKYILGDEFFILRYNKTDHPWQGLLFLSIEDIDNVKII